MAKKLKKAKKVVGQSSSAGMLKEVKVVPIDSVKLWSENPRKNDKAVNKLAKILKKHGIKSPLVVWEKNNTIYKGNTTWKAAKQAGFKSIPVAFVHFPSKEAAHAYALADNKASEWTDWDHDILTKMMSSNSFQRIDLSTTGFTEKEIKSLRLSSSNPDKLPDVNIQGAVEGKSDFMAVQFENKEELNRFREWIGIKVEHQRIFFFKDLKGRLKGWEDTVSKKATKKVAKKAKKKVR